MNDDRENRVDALLEQSTAAAADRTGCLFGGECGENGALLSLLQRMLADDSDVPGDFSGRRHH